MGKRHQLQPAPPQSRWHAAVTYFTANGPLTVEHDFEELEDLDCLIEAGPDWNCLRDIVVTLARRHEPHGWTVEQAAVA